MTRRHRPETPVRWMWWFLLPIALAAPAASGQTPGGAVQADSTSQASPTAVTEEAQRDYVAEVRANFTPENQSYWLRRTTLAFLGPIYSIVVGLLILFTGLSARLRDFAAARLPGRYGRILTYLALLTVITFVLEFPVTWYQGFALEHRFGLSNQTLGAWFGDELKGLGIGIVFFGVIPILMLAYLAIERSPRRWWMWLAAGTLPLILVGTLIEPLIIDPLFNKFVPLQNQQLKSRILALAEKAEIPGRRVYQVDKSRQTKKLNAYVSGFGASQRIVLWDTMLEAASEDEILFVMGHEMGHYKLAHIWKGIALYSALSIFLFWFAWASTRWAIARFGGRWGFHELHDIASLPLILAALGVISLIAQPAVNGFSRAIEHEADIYGVEVTRMNDAGARAFIKLAALNKSNPDPPALVKLFLYTHPPLVERIQFAQSYKPWQEGKPNRTFRGKE